MVWYSGKRTLSFSLIQRSHEFCKFPFHHPVGVLVFGEPAGPYIFDICLEGLDSIISQIRIFLHEFRRKGLEQAQDVADNHNLAIRIDPGPDRVDGNRQCIPYDFTDLRGNGLYQKGEDICLLDGSGVLDQFQGCFSRTPLGLEST